MTIKIDGDLIRFPSGKTVYAHCGIVRFSPENEITGGYDSGLDIAIDETSICPDLTIEEARELADYMIQRWQEFKSQLPSRPLATNSATSRIWRWIVARFG